MGVYKDLIIKYLTEAIDKIKADSSELDEEQMLRLAETLVHVPMSKAQACSYLNLSRSRFDDLVREGKIPKGRKKVGWKELMWYRDELDKCKNRK